MRRRVALQSAALAVVLAVACTTYALAAPITHTVVIDGVKYEPALLRVRRGDTIVWVNKDPFPHTVTSAGSFDSRAIPAGASWRYVARKTGEFAYLCTLHPNMVGTLTVQ